MAEISIVLLVAVAVVLFLVSRQGQRTSPVSTGPGNTTYKHCPWCAGDLVLGDIDGKKRLKCTSCRFVYWDNPRPVAVVLIPHGDGFVMIRRKLPPRAGMLALPGGFIEPYEFPEDGAKREVREETGLDIEIDRLLSLAMPKGVNEILFFYLAKPTSQTPVKGDDADEVHIFKRDQVPAQIAFDTHRRAIEQWLAESKAAPETPAAAPAEPAPAAGGVASDAVHTHAPTEIAISASGKEVLSISGGIVAPLVADSFLYPELEPYNAGRIEVGDGHLMYFEECGNPKGKPAVFVHGGPGGGVNPTYRRFFNPKLYRIVLFDQRGCGKSIPHASLENNTTWHLVEDMEKLRQYLGIEKWLVFGGSWGSTLSLAYAQTHPSRVTELVLRGIFLLRKKELDWFYQRGASILFPDTWEAFLKPIPADERDNLMAAYYKRLTSSDSKVQLEAARAWSIWEGSTSKLFPDKVFLDRYGDEQFALAFARIEAHYFVNGGFLSHENQLLANVPVIRQIPGIIVQGRYDVVCPMESAWELHRAWPEAKMIIVKDAGHSAMEGNIARALVAATDKFVGIE
jgi:proline iminopeptidase